MHILFTCSDRPYTSRNQFYRYTLQNRYTYNECISRSNTYPLRILSILLRLPFQIFKKDFYFISYIGHFLVIFIRFFSKKPIVFDFYLSLYDMMCYDRKIYSPKGLLGKITYWIEKKSLEKSDYIIVDTQKLIDILSKRYQINQAKFVRLPLTINEKYIFKKKVKRYSDSFTLLYVGSYIPLHGTKVIIETAKILQTKNIDITILMIGSGPDLKTCKLLAKKHSLTNVEFKNNVPMKTLNYYYNAVDIHLGLFNLGERANSIVMNKTYDSFRVGKPHITLETDAMKEIFINNKDIFFVYNIKPQTLAKKIITLKKDTNLVTRVGNEALHTYNTHLSHKKVQEILEEELFSKLEYSTKVL